MAEAPAMLQVEQRALDQQKQALAPDPALVVNSCS
jgi:hypothetical protein